MYAQAIAWTSSHALQSPPSIKQQWALAVTRTAADGDFKHVDVYTNKKMRLGLELNSQLTEWPSQHFKAVYSQFVLKKFCPDLPQLDERKIWLCKILCPLLSCYPKHLSEINADRPFFFFNECL